MHDTLISGELLRAPLVLINRAPAGGLSGHFCTYAVDLATLTLREIAGIASIETAFPGGGIAIGACILSGAAARFDGRS